jgi:hypothetical protein
MINGEEDKIIKAEALAGEEFRAMPIEEQTRAMELAHNMLRHLWLDKGDEDAFHMLSALKKMMI